MTRLLFLSLVLVVSAADGRAADGSLDASFGSGGRLRHHVGAATSRSGALAVTVQPDGRIVAAGHVGWGTFSAGSFAIVRYLPNGTFDPSFGGGTGRVITPVSGTGHPQDVLIQPDGKILAVGLSGVTDPGSHGFALVRYAADGTLDGTFGSGGMVFTSLPTGAAYKAALLSDGRIVVAGGLSNAAGLTYDAALARYHADGTLDASFGSGGTVVTNFGHGEFYDTVAINADESAYYVAGESYRPGPGRYGYDIDFVVARYLADGTLDPAFGTDGVVFTDFGTEYSDYEFVTAMALQPDGKVVVTGPVGGFGGLARYLSDGTLDPDFGDGGLVVLAQFGPGMNPRGIEVDADGRIVVAGTASRGIEGEPFGFPEGPLELAITRLEPDGRIDPTFAPCPQVTTSFPGANTVAWALAAQPDGKYVVVGETYDGTTQDFALARYGTASTPACQQADASKLVIRRGGTEARDSLSWRWTGPGLTAADLGDPTTDASYTLCVIDDVAGAARLGPGGPVLRAGWSGTSSGFRMRPGGEHDSPVTQVKLRPGDTTPGKITLKAKGEYLHPELPLTTPVVVRLSRDDAPRCWEATFDTHVSLSDGSSFVGRSDD